MGARHCSVRLLDETEWQDHLSDFGSYSYFVSPSYAAAWARHVGTHARARPYLVESNGTRLVAVFVERIISRRFGLRSLTGVPEGGYAIAGATMPGEMPWLESILREVRSPRLEYLSLVTDPLLDVKANMNGVAGLSSRVGEAFILEISDGYEAWLSKADRRVRGKLRKSQQDGLCTRRHGADALDTFYALYQKAFAQTEGRKLIYPKPFLNELLSAPGEAHARLYMTWFEGRPVAGGILLAGRKQALAWIGALDRDYAHLAANENRHAQVIRELSAEGFDTYNLGAAPGLPDVARFKQKLGAAPRRYCILDWHNPLISRARRILRRV